MKKTPIPAGIFLIGLFLPSLLFAQLAEEESLNPSEVETELAEKKEVLDNALEEIVNLKNENQALKEQKQLLLTKNSILTRTSTLLREGRLYEAAEELKKIYQIDPQDVENLSSLGIVYAELKSYTEAAKVFEQLIIVKPDEVKAYGNLGFVWAQMGQHDKAVENYLKALSLKPDFAPVHYNLALSYAQLGEREKAVRYFKSASNLFEPDSPWQRSAEQKALRYQARRPE